MYTFIPPESPSPGCSSGDVCSDSTAMRQRSSIGRLWLHTQALFDEAAYALRVLPPVRERLPRRTMLTGAVCMGKPNRRPQTATLDLTDVSGVVDTIAKRALLRTSGYLAGQADVEIPR